MKINNRVIDSLTERPLIPPTPRISERATTPFGDGDYTYQHRYDTRSFEFTTYDEIRFAYEPVTVEIDGFNYYGEVSDISYESVNVGLKKTKVKLTLQPFKYYSKENVPLAFGSTSTTTGTQKGVITGFGNIDSEPVIVVQGNKASPFSIAFGDRILKLASLDTQLTIDCRTHKLNVYDKNGHVRNDLLQSDFITLSPGLVGVAFPFGLKVTITCNWRSL